MCVMNKTEYPLLCHHCVGELVGADVYHLLTVNFITGKSRGYKTVRSYCNPSTLIEI